MDSASGSYGMVLAAWWLTSSSSNGWLHGRPTEASPGSMGPRPCRARGRAVSRAHGRSRQTSQSRCHGAVAPKADGEFPLTECQCGEPSSAFEATACSVLLMPCGNDDPRDKAGDESEAALKECKERAGRIVRRYSLSSAS